MVREGNQLKILYFTDSHVRGTNPENRKDDFPETIENKLKEIVEIANSNNVAAVLCGGDLFHSPDIAFSVARRTMRIFSHLTAPLWLTPGNHDFYGHNPETVERTLLGLLADLGAVHLLLAGERHYLEQDGVKLQLTGQPFHYEIDRRDPRLDYVIRKENCDFAVHVVHGMLVNKPLAEGVAYTVIERILETEADITLAGHNHLGFKDVEYQGKHFINCGGIARISNHLAEIKRYPQIVLIEFKPGGFTYQKIRLKTAKPGEEVLDRHKIEEMAEHEYKLAKFAQEIATSGELRILNIHEIIEEIAKRGLDRRVKEEAIRRIALAQEALRLRGE